MSNDLKRLDAEAERNLAAFFERHPGLERTDDAEAIVRGILTEGALSAAARVSAGKLGEVTMTVTGSHNGFPKVDVEWERKGVIE